MNFACLFLLAGAICSTGVVDVGQDAQGLVDRSVQAISPYVSLGRLSRIDRTDLVQIGGVTGVRIVIARGSLKQTGGGEGQGGQQPAKLEGPQPPLPDLVKEKHKYDWSYAQYIALPERTPSAKPASSAWLDLPSAHHVEVLYVGRKDGLDWFSFDNAFAPLHVRNTLFLEDGESFHPVWVRCLRVKDAGNHTRNGANAFLSRDPNLLPEALVEEIRKRRATGAGPEIHVLAKIRTAESTELLIDLYDDPVAENSLAAVSALRHSPFRVEARACYVDLIRRRIRVAEFGAAAAEFGWKEAEPGLKAVVDKPESLRELRPCYEYWRAVRGEPIDVKLLEAEEMALNAVYPGRDKSTFARTQSTLLSHRDTEAAAILALYMYDHGTKANTGPLHSMALETLKLLPRPTVAKLLKRVLLHGRSDDTRNLKGLAEKLGIDANVGMRQ